MPTFKRVPLQQVPPGSIVTRPQRSAGTNHFGYNNMPQDGMYLVVPYNSKRVFLCGIGGYWKYRTGKVLRGANGLYIDTKHKYYETYTVEVVHEATQDGMWKVPEDAV